MEGYNMLESLRQRVDQAFISNDYASIVTFVVANPSLSKSDPASIQRLLNNLVRLDFVNYIDEVFQALLSIGFVFDSTQYLEPLSMLIAHADSVTSARVIKQLIDNKVFIDAALIQKVIESCY